MTAISFRPQSVNTYHYNDVIMNTMTDVSNHRCLRCLLNCCFRHRSKRTSKLCITGLCAGNSLVTGEFPAQKACNAENVWWRHHHVFSGHKIWCKHVGILQKTATGSFLKPSKAFLKPYDLAVNLLVNGSTTCNWKLCCHWLKGLHWHHVNGLVQEGRNSSALAMELCLSCTKPSMCSKKSLDPIGSFDGSNALAMFWLHNGHMCDLFLSKI